MKTVFVMAVLPKESSLEMFILLKVDRKKVMPSKW